MQDQIDDLQEQIESLRLSLENLMFEFHNHASLKVGQLGCDGEEIHGGRRRG